MLYSVFQHNTTYSICKEAICSRVTRNMQTAKKEQKMKENKQNYLEAQDLYDQYKKSVEDGQCTERLGEMFITLTNHILRSPNFNRYPKEVKEDLSGHAIVKLMKSLKTVKLEFTAQQIFNFATRTVYTAFLSELGRHYKFENTKRAATRKYLESSPFIDVRTREDMISEIDSFEASLMEKKALRKK